MANETLTSVFSDIADAVRAKGVTGQMTPLQMPQKIADIPSGGGETPEAEWKDVNFIDYDGKNLYSYTTAEALALTELPPAPDRTSKGLTFQEWNYTLDEVKANANDTGKCTAGAIYFPTDGKTHLFITLPDEKFVGVQMQVSIKSGYSDTVEVDWGDGNTSSLTGGRWLTFDHTYNTNVFPSSYEIKLNTTGVRMYILSESGIFSSPSLPTNYVRNSIIDKIYFGTKIESARCIGYNVNLKEVVIPNNLTDRTIYGNYTGSLYGIVCPSEAVVNGLKGSALHVISIQPKRTSSSMDIRLGSGGSINGNIKRLDVPYNANQVGNDSGFKDFTSLQEFYLNTGVYLDFSDNAFYGCLNLRKVSFGDLANSSKIPAGFCGGCVSLQVVDFTRCSTLVLLSNTNAFSNTNTTFQIIVPDALYDDWVAATNWSTYASQIVKASEA